MCDRPCMTDTGKALWKEISGDGCRCYMYGSAFLSRRSCSNLSEVLGLGREGGLSRMMRMSDVREPYITGGASDHDKLKALCEVLPMWSGHPYYTAIHAILGRVFDIHEPLTPASLPRIWKQTAAYLFDCELTPADLPKLWGAVSWITALTPHELDNLAEEQTSCGEFYLYLDDLAKGLWCAPNALRLSHGRPAEDMAAYITSLVDTYEKKGCVGVAVELSAWERFLRPDPYRPSQAMLKLQEGKGGVQGDDLELITAQTLRLLGRACVEKGMKLTLLHPRPGVLDPLCRYLRSCDGLPMTATVTDQPCGICSVDTVPLLDLPINTPPELVFDAMTRLASQMPLGALGGLHIPVCEPIDLPLWADLGRSLCQCVADFGDLGRGTKNSLDQATVLKKILN